MFYSEPQKIVQSLATVKAVIFDMDGLLLDSERVYCSVWQKVLETHSFELTRAMYISQLSGRSSGLWNEAIRNLIGDKIDVAAMWHQAKLLWDGHLETVGIPLKEGALELLKHFSSIKKPLALVTNNDRQTADRCLKITGLNVFFSFIHTSDEFAEGESKTDGFLKAAQKLNVHPQDCVVFEDSETGVYEARRAGMKTCLVPDLHIPTRELCMLASLVLPSLNTILSGATYDNLQAISQD